MAIDMLEAGGLLSRQKSKVAPRLSMVRLINRSELLAAIRGEPLLEDIVS